MAEGWIRSQLEQLDVDAEVWSAGTEQTRVKPEAVRVMAEVGIDLSSHTSKTLWEVPDAWNFDLVLTVCDAANEACPAYPADTMRHHVSFPDPSGHDLDAWRKVRDEIGEMSRRLVARVARGDMPVAAPATLRRRGSTLFCFPPPRDASWARSGR
jgi:arsenate reductase